MLNEIIKCLQGLLTIWLASGWHSHNPPSLTGANQGEYSVDLLYYP